MPKLEGNVAEQVNSAESGSVLIEDGIYLMTLEAVESDGKDGQPLSGKAGPYWKWTLVFPADAERYAKRKQWVNTSLSADSAWKLKEHFDAFGVPADTDTDDLIGKQCMVQIGSRTITQGDRAGDEVNTVIKLLPVDGAKPAAAKGAKGTGKTASKDLF